MTRRAKRDWIVGILITLASCSMAHFQELIPSADIVDSMHDRTLSLEIKFTHPMENGPVMDMAEPRRFGVVSSGTRTDLLPTLTPVKIEGKTTYTASYEIKQPGDHIFFIEPAPYWEPAEQKMIIHYTKVTVNGFGDEDSWDTMVGFPVEIEPLVRPYGLWTGNVFRGIVRRDGQPVPFAEIEVEYLNVDGKQAIPSDPFVTQVIKADSSGLFCYALPKAGWWSFAALIDGDKPMVNPEGKEVDVELGALIWIKCIDME